MAKGYYCPIEGCDQHHSNWENPDEPAFETLDELRPHVRHTSDGDHDYSGIDFSALEPFDPTEDADDEDVADGDETENEDESSSMPTEEEYQQQHDGTDGEETTDDEDGTDEETGTEKTDNDDSGSSGFLPKMSTRTMVYLFAFLCLCVLAYKFLSDDTTSTAETAESDDEDDDNEADEEVPLVE